MKKTVNLQIFPNFKIVTALKKEISLAAIVLLIASLFLIAGCISYEEGKVTVNEEGKDTVNEEGIVVKNVSLRIYTPNWNITYDNVTTTNTTAYTLLLECAAHYNFSVESTYYGSMDSMYINSINGIENGENNSYWIYYVNGNFAEVGCSKYVLHDNDVVEWRFEKNPWS